jgi:hypothetical protein
MPGRSIHSTWITDITDFLDASGAIPDEIPDPARNLAKHFGATVAAMTHLPRGLPDGPDVKGKLCAWPAVTVSVPPHHDRTARVALARRVRLPKPEPQIRSRGRSPGSATIPPSAGNVMRLRRTSLRRNRAPTWIPMRTVRRPRRTWSGGAGRS